jgi:hypothetical protein
LSNSGFIQLRRGLSEHVRDGRLSFFEASLYVFILMDTNPATGLCYGSAGLFAAVYGLSNRTCRDALEKLENKGYLRRFPTRGKHGSYPILVNKFRCSDGAMKGKYVNCFKSDSYIKVAYESCDDDVNESAVASVNESAARIDTREEILETRDKKQKPSAKPKAPADQRFGLFREDFERDFKYVNKVAAPWDAREASNLSRWLKANPEITQEQWRNILRNRRASPLSKAAPLSQWIGKSLSWLAGQADEWGKEIKPNGGRNAAVSQGRGQKSVGVLEEFINDTERGGDAYQNGNIPAGEHGQGDPEIIHGVSGRLGFESVPSGHEKSGEF